MSDLKYPIKGDPSSTPMGRQPRGEKGLLGNASPPTSTAHSSFPTDPELLATRRGGPLQRRAVGTRVKGLSAASWISKQLQRHLRERVVRRGRRQGVEGAGAG